MLNAADIKTIPDENMRRIIEECFELILKLLGTDNFLRWLNEEEIDEKVKTLIVTNLDKTKYPNWSGYYDGYSNELSVTDTYSYLDTLKVLNHEFNHFLSNKNFKKIFSGFINEGITEYLAQQNMSNSKTYHANVDLATFLHYNLGDILIKAYFTGDTRKVEDKLKSYLGTTEFYETINKLKQIYNDCYKATFEETTRILNENIEFFVNLYTTIYKGIIIERANNLEFYKDGKIDTDEIKNSINIANQKIPTKILNYLENNNKLVEYQESLIKEILLRSHLAIGDDFEINKKEIERYSKGIYHSDTYVINKIKSKNNMEFQNLFLLQCKNKNINTMSIHEKADIIFKILNKFPSDYVSKLTNMPYMEQILGSNYKEIIQYYLDNKNTYINIDKIIDNRTKNTIESTFLMINPSLFIEKRDNAFYLISRPQSNYANEYELKGENPILVKTMYMFDNQGNLCLFYVNLDKELNKITFIPNNIKGEKVLNLEEFELYMKSMPYITKIMKETLICKRVLSDNYKPYQGIEGLYNRKGAIGIKGDDYRTVRINASQLKETLEKLKVFLPNNNFKNTVKFILSYYLSCTYHIDKVQDEIINNLYDILFENSHLDIYDIEQKLNKMKDKVMDELARMPVQGENREELYAKKKKNIEQMEFSINKINSSAYVNNYLEKVPDKSHFYGLPIETESEYGIMHIDIIGLTNIIKIYTRLCHGIKNPNDYINNIINKQIDIIISTYGIDAQTPEVLELKQKINSIIKEYVKNEDPQQILLLENIMVEISKLRKIPQKSIPLSNEESIFEYTNAIDSIMRELLNKLKQYDESIETEENRAIFMSLWKEIMNIYRYTSDKKEATNRALKLANSLDYFFSKTIRNKKHK